jgi:ornithine carbamoyltransferase
MGVRHFLSLEDLSLDELWAVLDLAAAVKATPDKYSKALSGKSLAMIFQKKSTRTRVSFETGMFQLGGMALFLGANDIQIGRGETIADTARVISRYNDIIMARVYGHDVLEEMAAYATVPVINGLSDALHPCQVLADLQTMREQFGDIRGLTFTYIGDGNNMAHSLMVGCARAGVNVRIAAPAGYEPDEAYVSAARSHARITGAEVVVTNDPAEASTGAHVLYTDVWASMGQEEEQAKRLVDFEGFQVDGRLMSLASNDAIFMHCLPAHRGEEVSAEVCDGPRSVIFDEAENRLHAQKALMLFLLGAG